MINVITGILKPDSGQIFMEGVDLVPLPSYRIAHLGINRTYQTPKPFSSLTVTENVKVAYAYGSRRKGQDEKSTIREILKLTDLEDKKDSEASSLNTFDRKMLDLARALITSPKILLVDELAAGLNPDEIRQMVSLLAGVRDGGTSLIVVEHVMSFIRNICERVVVMDSGSKIYEGDFNGAANDPTVKEVYLGRRTFA